MVADPPDASDLRPGHDYALVSGTGNDVGGRLFLYDSVWDRLVVFDKATGDYLGQWAPGPDGPSMEDMRGFYVVPKTKQKPEAVVWLTPEGLYRAALTVQTTGDPARDGQAEQARPTEPERARLGLTGGRGVGSSDAAGAAGDGRRERPRAHAFLAARRHPP